MASSVLEQLKNQEVANKPKPVSSEEQDKEVVEEEAHVDPGVERYLDVPITQGLTSELVEKRKSEGLTNSSGDDKGKTYLEIVLTSIFTFFNMLYLAITILLIIIGRADQLIFLFAVILNFLIGLVQEIISKKKVDKLRLMSAPVATVIRDSQKLEIPTGEVVLDDIIMYTSGKQICADSVVLDGSIEVNEALLTGEADAIPKTKGAKLFAGSFVSSGTCVARVDKTGKPSMPFSRPSKSRPSTWYSSSPPPKPRRSRQPSEAAASSSISSSSRSRPSRAFLSRPPPKWE